jgi:hypothetical protein
MKAILITLLAVLTWVLVGYFFPTLSISLTVFYLPILFVIVTLSIETNKYLYIAICFVLVLLNDYLFRIYGGGIHDDAGRALCELVFYTTLVTSTVTLIIIKIIDSNAKLKSPRNFKVTQIVLDIVFVLAPMVQV